MEHHQKFNIFINGKTLEITEDELFELLSAKLKSKSDKNLIDSLFSNVIIHLKNCSDDFIDKSAEKLPDLIKYMAFMLVPIPIISKLFESRHACLPSQIELAQFIIRFFDVVGISAVSFVHYINPEYLPRLQLVNLNKKFKEFDCLYLFPDFQINIPSSYELRNLTLQCQIEKQRNINLEEKLIKLDNDKKEKEKEIADIISKDKSEIEEKRSKLKDIEQKVKKYEVENQELKDRIQKIQDKEKETAELNVICDIYENSYEQNKSVIRKYYHEIQVFDVNNPNGNYAKMNKEIEELQNEIETKAKDVENDEQIAPTLEEELKNLLAEKNKPAKILPKNLPRSGQDKKDSKTKKADDTKTTKETDATKTSKETAGSSKKK